MDILKISKFIHNNLILRIQTQQLKLLVIVLVLIASLLQKKTIKTIKKNVIAFKPYVIKVAQNIIKFKLDNLQTSLTIGLFTLVLKLFL